MSFGFINLRDWLFACLTLGVLPLALAQSAGPGQQIIFSSPDGGTVSNVLPPVVQAPAPEESADPSATPSVSVFQSLDPTPSTPLMVTVSRPRPQKTEDPGKSLKLLTPAQVMGVQTIRQIFGMPDRDSLRLGGPTNSNGGGGNTNYTYSDDSSSDDSQWAKFLSENMGENTSGSNQTGNSQSMLSGFFASTPRRGFFDDPDKSADNSVFNASPAAGPPAQSLGWDSFTQPATTPEAGSPQNVSSFGSGAGSQSPFALPKESTPETLPQLPSLPSVSGQNYTPPPVTPSWEPKPPPWLSPVPAPGTMPQRKF